MNLTAQIFVDKIEQEHNVKVLAIVEAGSRSWGFATPESDTDYLFIYKHPLERYVSINPPSENISCPDNSFQGYDLFKAGKLLAACNPNLFYALSTAAIGPAAWNDVTHYSLRIMARRFFNKKRMMHGTFGVASQHMGRLEKARAAGDLKDALKTTLHLVRYLLLLELLENDTFIDRESYGFFPMPGSEDKPLLDSANVPTTYKVVLAGLIAYRSKGERPAHWGAAEDSLSLSEELDLLYGWTKERLEYFKTLKFEYTEDRPSTEEIDRFIQIHLGFEPRD